MRGRRVADDGGHLEGTPPWLLVQQAQDRGDAKAQLSALSLAAVQRAQGVGSRGAPRRRWEKPHLVQHAGLLGGLPAGRADLLRRALCCSQTLLARAQHTNLYNNLH